MRILSHNNGTYLCLIYTFYFQGHLIEWLLGRDWAVAFRVTSGCACYLLGGVHQRKMILKVHVGSRNTLSAELSLSVL